MDDWIAIDGPEDIPHGEEVLLWDGCDYHLDYVESDPEYGIDYFANGASEITHYKEIEPPKE